MRVLACMLLGVSAACATPAGAQEDVLIGGFIYRNLVDPMTDADLSFIATPEVLTDEPRAALLWGCRVGELSVILSAGEFLALDAARGQFRFDAMPASPELQWNADTEGRAFFLPQAVIQSFTRTALAASKVLIKIENHRGTPRYFAFELDGLIQALDRLPCRPSAGKIAREGKDRIVDFELLEEKPQLLNQDDAAKRLARVYPDSLRKAGVEGHTVLRFIVEQDGSVRGESVSVVSSTHDAFTEAALRAVQAFRFTPAKIAGYPVAVTITMPFAWTLEDGEERR